MHFRANIAAKSELNYYVLKVIDDYEGGKYPYLFNNDYENYNGVTENIIYQGALIAKANPDGSKSSYCVGLTYEVFFKAMQKRNVLIILLNTFCFCGILIIEI